MHFYTDASADSVAIYNILRMPETQHITIQSLSKRSKFVKVYVPKVMSLMETAEEQCLQKRNDTRQKWRQTRVRSNHPSCSKARYTLPVFTARNVMSLLQRGKLSRRSHVL